MNARKRPPEGGRPDFEPVARPVSSKYSPVLRYLEDREKVAGRRVTLHHDPTVAADFLASQLGHDRAVKWAYQLLAALQPRRGAA